MKRTHPPPGINQSASSASLHPLPRPVGTIRIVWQYPSKDLCVRTEPFDRSTATKTVAEFIDSMYHENVHLDESLRQARVIATEHEYYNPTGQFVKEKLPVPPSMRDPGRAA